jgi:hypothetical protein
MNPTIFSEWLVRQGFRVIHTESSYWYNAGPMICQSFPYHLVIRPSAAELEGLLRGHKMIGARFSTPIDEPEGMISYHMIFDDKEFALSHVRKSTRETVRKGLDSCDVVRISLEQYAEDGWILQCDTDARQGRGKSYTKEAWRNRALSAVGLDGFEAWGAFVDGRLAAALFLVQVDECVDILYQQSLREYLPLRVNNALTFVVTQDLMKRPSLQKIHYGLHSLSAPASVDKFKVSMGYSARPLRQRVVIHPAIPRAIIPPTGKVLKMATKLLPKNDMLAKAEGIVRFFVEGRLPLRDQEFPELLGHIRQELSGSEQARGE